MQFTGIGSMFAVHFTRDAGALAGGCGEGRCEAEGAVLLRHAGAAASGWRGAACSRLCLPIGDAEADHFVDAVADFLEVRSDLVAGHADRGPVSRPRVCDRTGKDMMHELPDTRTGGNEARRQWALVVIGAWLMGSVCTSVVATQNFYTIDRLLAASPNRHFTSAVAQLGQPLARDLLRYLSSELNRLYFQIWNAAQLVFGALVLWLEPASGGILSIPAVPRAP